MSKKTDLERFLGRVIDIFTMLFYPKDPLVEISFVVTIEIGVGRKVTNTFFG